MEQTLQDLIFEFMQKVDEIYLTQHDSLRGFHLGKEDFEQKQKDFAGAGGFAIEYLDGTTFTYGVGDPNNPQSEWLVSCT